MAAFLSAFFAFFFSLFTHGTALPPVIKDPGDASYFPHDTAFIATFAAGNVYVVSNPALGVGIVNSSWWAPEGSNPIKTANLYWIPSAQIRPWNGSYGSDTNLCIRSTITVPQSYLRGSLANYVGMDIWLRDGSIGKPTSGKEIIISAFVFDDNRPGATGGPYDYLAFLNAVQFREPLGTDVFLTSTGSPFHQKVWNVPKDFGYCVSKQQVMNLLVASSNMLGGTIDINDIEVHQAGESNELALAQPSSQSLSANGASMTTFFKNLGVYIVSR
jgi:hypothetical protein